VYRIITIVVVVTIFFVTTIIVTKRFITNAVDMDVVCIDFVSYWKEIIIERICSDLMIVGRIPFSTEKKFSDNFLPVSDLTIFQFVLILLFEYRI